MMKTKDQSRKWMWWFLAALLALQLYFVRELLAAFALFVVGFAALTLVIMALYAMQKAWEMGITRIVESGHPAVNLVRRGVSAVEDLGRRAFRPGSAPAR